MVFPTSVSATPFGSYSDLPTGHWAHDYVEQMFNAGALDDPPPLYQPNVPITRGKFARYLVVGWGLAPYSGPWQFLSDVPPTHQYFKFINALYTRGIMVGSGGFFGVGFPLTREQAAAVLVRAAGREEAARLRPAADAEAIVARYRDRAQISPWAVPYVAEAYVAGLFLGDAGGTFRPLGAMTKAEACAVCYRTKQGQALLDFGDAPDWPPFFNFPSRLINNGARHENWKTVWLGERADGELDSRQINSDFFDDGFVAFVPGPPGAAPTMQIKFEVSVAARNPADKTPLYFNLLVDWDRDMKWEPNEWMVQNMVIDPNAWPAGVMMQTLLSTPFVPAGDPYASWFRLTLTKGEMATVYPITASAQPGWVGHGLFKYGETEDYGPEEQKMIVLEDLVALVQEWTGSQSPAYLQVGASLADIIPRVQDLIAEEQSDDPVLVLLEKKKKPILDLLYKAAQQAVQLGLSQSDVNRIFEGLWKRMAFITEEEAKRHVVDILRETLRLNFNIPPSASQQIQHILNDLADLIYEQERGDPAEVLLRKKADIIKALEELIAALQAAKLPGPAASAKDALAWMLFIKALEEPIPPQPPTEPPWPPLKPPDKGGLITGVHSIFEVKDGVVKMKVHLLGGYGLENKVYDIEVYYAHQQNWPAGTALTPASAPEGWSSASADIGTRFWSSTPMPVCTPLYFTFNTNANNLDNIIIILTDKDGKPIGHSVSQQVHYGFMSLPPGGTGDLSVSLIPGAPPEKTWDVQYALLPDPTHQGALMPWLVTNPATGGGIQLLPKGLGELLPGDYVPQDGYTGDSGPVLMGQYYALRDHTGLGYALLYVASLTPNGCLLECEYNPHGTMEMKHLPREMPMP
jgi:hypothetical protein